jgi:Fic family protein
MFPAFSKPNNPAIEELKARLLLDIPRLGADLKPAFRSELSSFMSSVTSYYTNAMEGNRSKLKDIEDALNNRLAPASSSTRNFQLEHVAHIKTQSEMLARLDAEPDLDVCSAAFICWLHERFYTQLPAEMRFAQTEGGKKVPVVPGEIRSRGVVVGQHVPPEDKAAIIQCTDNFRKAYAPSTVPLHLRLDALAASHHRLLWIHPFADGNGRVARLFTSAYTYRIGMSGNGLWNVARAFARDRVNYDSHLHSADLPRRNDLDGRGPLSEETLGSFCHYFLSCCVDQVEYMGGLLRTGGIESRLSRYLAGLIRDGTISSHAATVLEVILREGELKRAEVGEICGLQQRQATKVIKEVLSSGLARVTTDSSYGPLGLKLTTDLAVALFPGLGD